MERLKMQHNLVGFGFGPIQAGLFVAEARSSGAFDSISVAEIDAELVAAVRRNGGRYCVNVARRDGVDVMEVAGVEVLNPNDSTDRIELGKCLASATEIVTSLPSVQAYATGGEDSVAGALAQGLRDGRGPVVVYTAENNNHAAEILRERVHERLGDGGASRPCQFLDTVIGKMSQVVLDPEEVARRKLAPMAPGLKRAFLVEEFNHILTSRIDLPGFSPGITVFVEKEELLPFEDAKLFGHNAIHTLLGFLGRHRGCRTLAELRHFPDVMTMARKAFIEEAGAGLIRRHSHLGDPLFTSEGLAAHVDDLLQRMTNPHLGDAVARIIRDPVRKLGFSDRIFGAIRLCREQGIDPVNLAAGARAGLRCLMADREISGLPIAAATADRDLTVAETIALLQWLWPGEDQKAALEIGTWLARTVSPSSTKRVISC